MAHYPQNTGDFSYISYPSTVAAGTTITSGGTVNTKGAYVEFVASSPFTCNYIYLQVISASVNFAAYLIDIATGAAGAETVVIPNLSMDRINSTTSHGGHGTFACPMAIPSGTRVSARCQSNTGSATVELVITLGITGGTPGINTYTNYGSTINSNTVQIEPGTTSDAKGAYSQLTASTSAIIQGLILMVSTFGFAASTNRRWSLDLATGAAGNETVIIPNIRFGAVSNTIVTYPRSHYFPVYIPASTRLAARASCSTNTVNDRLIYVAILGGTAPVESAGGGSAAVAYVG